MAHLSRTRRCHGRGSAALGHYLALRSRTRLIQKMRKHRRPMKFLTKRSRDQHSLTHMQISSAKYSFDAATGEGKLDLCGTPVSIHQLKTNFPPPHLIHPNILDIYFHDFYNRVTICSRKGVEFREWLQELNLVDTYTIDDFENNTTATSIPFYCRKMFDGILRGLFYIHECGYAIEDLSEDNLCVVGETMKFWKMEVTEVSDELRRRNFISMHLILSKVIEKLAPECPEDMKHLLDILESPSTTDLQDKVQSHMALLSPTKRLLFITQIFEMRGYSKKHRKRWGIAARKFFEKLNMNGWYEKYETKIIGRVRRCFFFRQGTDSYKTDVAGSMTETGVVEQFFKFLRNLAYHIGEKKGEKSWSKVHIDAILFWAFGKEIIIFIDLLKDEGLEFNVESEHFILRDADADADADSDSDSDADADGDWNIE